jgi:hypothetical protein
MLAAAQRLGTDGTGRAAGPAAPDAPVILRRRGRRPLSFRGARLLSSVFDDAATGARFTLELYRSEAGPPVAALVFDPPPGSGGSAVHLAEEVPHPGALEALLAALDPASALPWPETAEAAGERLGLLAALRRAEARFRETVGAWFAPAPHRNEPRDGRRPLEGRPVEPHAVKALSQESHQMNQMTAYHDAVDGKMRQSPAGMISLKRVGQKPLSFMGVETAMAMSFMPGAPSWYEINLYKTSDGGVVAAVKLFHRDEDAADLCRAWEFSDLGAAVSHLESFDPAADIRVDVEPDDPALSLPEMAAHALALRAKAEEARRQYRTILGELLHDLEAA